MNTGVRQNPFSAAHMGITKCFCGDVTVADHDFCFCSPECARADAMTSLGGDDSHYRKIVRKAYVSCGARPPAIYKRKIGIAKHVPAIPQPPGATHQHNKQNVGDQHDGSAKKEMVFPTLAQVTTAVLARKAKEGGEATVETSVKTPQVAAQIFLDTLPLAPPIQKTSPGLDQGVHKSPLTRLRGAPQQNSPLKVDNKTVGVRSQPSILYPEAEERGRANGDTTAAIRPLGSLRGSTSFAGWHGPAEHRDRVSEGESLKEVFAQLEDIRAWIEGWDGVPDTN